MLGWEKERVERGGERNIEIERNKARTVRKLKVKKKIKKKAFILKTWMEKENEISTNFEGFGIK